VLAVGEVVPKEVAVEERGAQAGAGPVEIVGTELLERSILEGAGEVRAQRPHLALEVPA
jgi:hypothetical protein